MERSAGLLLVVIGAAVVVIGLLVWSGALNWFGQLPGDIRVEGERTRVFVPITSMVIASIVLTLVVNLVGRWLR